MVSVIDALWALRTELMLLAPLAAIYLWLSPLAGEDVAFVATGMVASLVLATGPSRRWVLHRLWRARLRRKWQRACADVELTNKHDSGPSVIQAEKVPVGDELTVRMFRGSSVDDLDAKAEKIAAAMGVRELRVTRSDHNAGVAKVVIVRRDSLDVPAPLTWPVADADLTSLWFSVPVGVDENGKNVSIDLPERNVLIGGEPGAGKSAAVSVLASMAALDPTVKLWLLDGKMVELAVWSKIAERTVGPSVEDAVDLLRSLQAEMNERYEHLLAEGLRKVGYGDGFPLHMVVCDELAFYLTCSDRKLRGEFSDLMRDVVSRGRAAGIIVVAATQKPAHDVIPTSLRDLFGFRWAMRCNTPQASDTILGTGWATQGFDAAKIPGAQRGVGFLHAEDQRPVKLRCYYLSDGELAEIAERAAKGRNLDLDANLEESVT